MFPRALGQGQKRRLEPTPAAAGGSRGYDAEHRQDAIALWVNGVGDLATPSLRSIMRWRRQGIGRLQQTGNAPAQNLNGEHEFLLIFCRLLYPKVPSS